MKFFIVYCIALIAVMCYMAYDGVIFNGPGEVVLSVFIFFAMVFTFNYSLSMERGFWRGFMLMTSIISGLVSLVFPFLYFVDPCGRF